MLELHADPKNRTTVVLHLIGRVTSETAEQAEAGFTELLVDEAIQFIVVDMAAVDFITSAGLRIMITQDKALQKRDGFLVVANPSPQVFEVLEIAGMLDFFKSAESVDAALALIATSS